MGLYSKTLFAFLMTSTSLGLLAAPPVALPSAPAAKQLSPDEALLRQISKGFSKVAKKATPAVVYIECQAVAEDSPLTRRKKGPFENPFDNFQDEFFNRFFGFPIKKNPQKNQKLCEVQVSLCRQMVTLLRITTSSTKHAKFP